MGLFDAFKKKESPKPRPQLPPRPLARGLAPHPEPQADNHFVVITLDSCRWDSFMAAEPKTITKLGKVEKRYTYASWTAPSHYNLLTGLLPHTTPENVYASEYYKEDFYNYNERLGTKGIEFAKMVPSLWFPTFLRNTLGYKTCARVSLPVLNPKSGINRYFDDFQLMDSHNDMAAMLPTRGSSAMARPRRAANTRACSSLIAPAMARAEISPTLWPQTTVGRTPQWAHRAAWARLTATTAGWVYRVSRKRSSSASRSSSGRSRWGRSHSAYRFMACR